MELELMERRATRNGDSAQAHLNKLNRLVEEQRAFFTESKNRLEGKLGVQAAPKSAKRSKSGSAHFGTTFVVGQWVEAFYRNTEWIPGKIMAIKNKGSTSFTVHFAQKGVTQKGMTKMKAYAGTAPEACPRIRPAEGARVNSSPVAKDTKVLASFLGHEMREAIVVAVDHGSECCDINFLELDRRHRSRSDITVHGIPLVSVYPTCTMDAAIKPYKETIDEFCALPNNRDFMRPIRELFDEHVIPGYFGMIKETSDLGTVRICVNAGYYNGHVADLISDAERIWTNCIQFNGEASPYGMLGQGMLTSLRKKFAAFAAEASRPVPDRHAVAAAPHQSAKRQKVLSPVPEERPMAYEEKEALLGQIQELDPDKQDKVVQVIQASSEVDDDEIDLGSLPDALMWKLRALVDTF